MVICFIPQSIISVVLLHKVVWFAMYNIALNFFPLKVSFINEQPRTICWHNQQIGRRVKLKWMQRCQSKLLKVSNTTLVCSAKAWDIHAS